MRRIKDIPERITTRSAVIKAILKSRLKDEDLLKKLDRLTPSSPHLIILTKKEAKTVLNCMRGAEKLLGAQRLISVDPKTATAAELRHAIRSDRMYVQKFIDQLEGVL